MPKLQVINWREELRHRKGEKEKKQGGREGGREVRKRKSEKKGRWKELNIIIKNKKT